MLVRGSGELFIDDPVERLSLLESKTDVVVVDQILQQGRWIAVDAVREEGKFLKSWNEQDGVTQTAEIVITKKVGGCGPESHVPLSVNLNAYTLVKAHMGEMIVRQTVLPATDTIVFTPLTEFSSSVS